jgi:hypothetical protein
MILSLFLKPAFAFCYTIFYLLGFSSFLFAKNAKVGLIIIEISKKWLNLSVWLDNPAAHV